MFFFSFPMDYYAHQTIKTMYVNISFPPIIKATVYSYFKSNTAVWSKENRPFLMDAHNNALICYDIRHYRTKFTFTTLCSFPKSQYSFSKASSVRTEKQIHFMITGHGVSFLTKVHAASSSTFQ